MIVNDIKMLATSMARTLDPPLTLLLLDHVKVQGACWRGTGVVRGTQGGTLGFTLMNYAFRLLS